MSENEIVRPTELATTPQASGRTRALLAYLEHLQAAGIDVQPRYSITGPFARNPLPIAQAGLLSLNQTWLHH